jgi:hypothetical protein
MEEWRVGVAKNVRAKEEIKPSQGNADDSVWAAIHSKHMLRLERSEFGTTEAAACTK